MENLDKVIVTAFGALAIVLTYWFFLMKRGREVAVSDSVDITVNGGYSPEVISISKGKTTRINFLRTDPTECLSEVVLADFKIKKQLPLNQKVTVEITPQKTGEYGYSCSMNMFHGKIIVK
ncbi:MAG: Cupredoxin family domain protein [Candidatus Daviesbacteria bacterium GW2011_GWC1_40_9]|nr:MAG: Cupredoxin family domain protein [Candidatus Daviesbacteria bacterium GW2011_GWC1_40_9]